MTRTDVVVIGMGPGGEHVAGKLAAAGLDVVGVERRLLGGECPYWGCVPSKMMVRAADALAEGRRIPNLAGRATVEPDWAPVATRIRAEATDDWDDTVAVERFEDKGGRFVRGAGRMVGPGRVVVGDETYEADRAVVLASGTEPAVPPIPGLDQIDFWTNRDAIETETRPESLIVLGGGAIGAELAQVFARFGSEVTVVEALDRLLANEEPEVGERLADVFAHDGITVHTGVKVVAVEGGAANAAAIVVRLEDGRSVHAAHLLVATGRRTNLASIGVGAIGIDESAPAIPVDEHLRVVGADRVWAVGDITGKGAFTHVAMYQAGIAIDDILGRDHRPADYKALPRVTFTDPEVGSVGSTEAAARKAGVDVRTGAADVASTARGWIHRGEGLVKLVADADRQVLVGATAMAPNGGEVLGLLALAVHSEVPVDDLRSMIYAYPTFHRGIEDALRDLSL